MQLPKTIKVGPFIYAVNSPEGLDNLRDQPGCVGRSRFQHQTLAIAESKLGPDYVAETLLHEVLHVVQDAVGILVEDKLPTEQYITRISPTLLATLRGNPELVAFLLGTPQEV